MKNIKSWLLLLCLALGGHLLAQQDVQLTNLKPVNTDRLDFTPVPFGDGLMYTSSKANRFLNCPSDNPGDYTDLMFSKKDANGEFTKPVPLQGEVNAKYNDGAPTFNAIGNKMIFTRNNVKGKNPDGVIDLKLYSADLVGDEWVNVTPLPFNTEADDFCHPALSKDGSLLVFSSNQPGSQAHDLWYSKLVNGNWSSPVNMGPAINTGKNELFPYLDENNNLFFSSNRDGGLGGLDLYAARMNASGQWEMIGGLGAPFNTGNDDVNFV